MSFSYMNDPFDIFFTSRGKLEPQTNIGHNNKEILLQVSLPGFSRSDIDVEVNSGRLSVRTKGQKLSTEYEYSTREIFLSDYNRTWSTLTLSRPPTSLEFSQSRFLTARPVAKLFVRSSFANQIAWSPILATTRAYRRSCVIIILQGDKTWQTQ